MTTYKCRIHGFNPTLHNAKKLNSNHTKLFTILVWRLYNTEVSITFHMWNSLNWMVLNNHHGGSDFNTLTSAAATQLKIFTNILNYYKSQNDNKRSNGKITRQTRKKIYTQNSGSHTHVCLQHYPYIIEKSSNIFNWPAIRITHKQTIHHLNWNIYMQSYPSKQKNQNWTSKLRTKQSIRQRLTTITR